METDRVIWTAGGIGMMYHLEQSPGILDSLDNGVANSILRLGRDGFYISSGLPLRLSADNQTAVFGLNFELRGEPNAVYIYLLQSIPDSDYLLYLLLILFPNDWRAEDTGVLEELSAQIGIDLIAYWPWNLDDI